MKTNLHLMAQFDQNFVDETMANFDYSKPSEVVFAQVDGASIDQDSKKHGPAVIYTIRDGTVESINEGQNKNGVPVGTWTLITDDYVQKTTYESPGMVVEETINHKTGTYAIGKKVDGVREGLWREESLSTPGVWTDETVEISTTQVYAHGMKFGAYTFESTAGPYAFGTIKNNKKSGLKIAKDDKGQISTQVYKDNKVDLSQSQKAQSLMPVAQTILSIKSFFGRAPQTEFDYVGKQYGMVKKWMKL